MSENYSNRTLEIQQTILAALCVILALVGGCWFLAYRVYTTAPATETITVTLPPEMVASKVGLAEPLQTIEIEREKPGRKWFSALLHPLGFGFLLLVIVGTGGGLILLVIWLDRGARDG